jgi:hypothetical protein
MMKIGLTFSGVLGDSPPNKIAFVIHNAYLANIG